MVPLLVDGQEHSGLQKGSVYNNHKNDGNKDKTNSTSKTTGNHSTDHEMFAKNFYILVVVGI